MVDRLDGLPWLMAILLYGAGLRLMECEHLRVRDVDFDCLPMLVRDGRGQKDRAAMLPEPVQGPLRLHLEKAECVHEQSARTSLKGQIIPRLHGSPRQRSYQPECQRLGSCRNPVVVGRRFVTTRRYLCSSAPVSEYWNPCL